MKTATDAALKYMKTFANEASSFPFLRRFFPEPAALRKPLRSPIREPPDFFFDESRFLPISPSSS
jgi:hypothetical protein